MSEGSHVVLPGSRRGPDRAAEAAGWGSLLGGKLLANLKAVL